MGSINQADTKKLERFYFLILLVLAVATTGFRIYGWNVESRMATVQALVELKTFRIDDTLFANTGDKVFINGFFYSSKPVATSILGAIIYLPLYQLGIKLDFGPNVAFFLITFFTVKLFWFFSIIAFYRTTHFFNLSSKKRLYLSLAVAFGTLNFTYSSTFSNNSISASLLLIGVYYIFKAKFDHPTTLNLFLSGLFLALAASVDIPTSIFYAIFLVYILLEDQLRKHVWIYLLPLAITILPAYYYYYFISGSFLPFQISEGLYQYSESPFTSGANKLSGIVDTDLRISSFLRYLLNLLFWERGIFLYNPLLIISSIFIYKEIKQKGRYHREAFAVVAGSVGMILMALFFTTNYGGDCYGARWLVPIVPINLIWLYPIMERLDNKRRRIFLITSIVSILIAAIGIIEPWSSARLSNFSILSNLILIQKMIEVILYY